MESALASAVRVVLLLSLIYTIGRVRLLVDVMMLIVYVRFFTRRYRRVNFSSRGGCFYLLVLSLISR